MKSPTLTNRFKNFLLSPRISISKLKLNLLMIIISLIAIFLGVYLYQTNINKSQKHEWVFHSRDVAKMLNQTAISSDDTLEIDHQNVKGTTTDTPTEFTTYFKEQFTDPDSIVFDNNIAKISFFTKKNQDFGTITSDHYPRSTENSLTYSDIFPRVDLRYAIFPTRLLEEFIIKDRETANKLVHIEQIANTDCNYQINPNGSITFTKNGIVVFTLPAPVLYEFNDKENVSYGIKYAISQNNGQLSVTKNITQEGLDWINDPERTFPIIIDLVIDNGDTSSNWISSNTRYTTVSQETTIKQEGTGSVKIQTTPIGTSDLDQFEYSTDGTARTGYVTDSYYATGGTESTSGLYRIHKFTSTGSYTANISGSVEILVVGGGGGGATGGGPNGTGGGGGGGGVLYNASFSAPSGVTTTTVGNGGNTSANGNNSVFSSLTAYGGGLGGTVSVAGGNGGSGGGGGSHGALGGTGTSGQGNNGGNGVYAAGGGGGGAGGAGQDGQGASENWGGSGGAGVAYSITGSSVYYGGGGSGGGSSTGGSNPPGTGGTAAGSSGAANTGAGGGSGGTGGSGIVVIKHLDTPLLSYSESSIKSKGSYSLKGVAKATNSLNKKLTHTFASTMDLSNVDSATIKIRASRTGSNIKLGLHDTGGPNLEITPNITVANTFQTATFDLSGISNVAKDSIDTFTVTITNADADNTFYLDDFTYDYTSVNHTVTRTVSPLDLSSINALTYWVRSSVAGSFARFQFGESASTEQTNTITINSANTWEMKTWDISAIAAASRNAVTKLAFQFTGDTQGATFYFDEIKEANQPPNTPTLDSPADTAVNVSHTPILKTTATDNDLDTLKYKIILCTDLAMTANCQTYDQTITSTGWSNTSYSSGAQAQYTVPSPLSYGANYYWRSYAIDEAGTNTWSSTQATPYSFSIDLTPPSTVSSLSSTSHTLSTWSNDTTIDVTWTAATDTGGSGVAGYSYLFDTSASTTPDTVMDGVTTNTTSPVQSDSNLIYFHIRAVDNDNNWGSASHLGPFYIDATSPSAVSDLTSTSHTLSTWSNDTTIDVTWTAATDTNGSGVAGYSYLFDTSATTTPDTVMDGVTTNTTSPVQSDSNLIYFHIRAVDNDNNWGSTSHLGPFYIDTTPPSTVSNLTSTSHSLSNWSNDTTIDVSWTAATDTDGSGIAGYSYLFDTSATTIPDTTTDSNTTSAISPTQLDSNSVYFHIRAVDNVGNWGSASHLGPFYIDTTSPSVISNLTSTSHTTSIWSIDTTIDVSWTAATDTNGSGVAGYSYLFDTTPLTDPDTTPESDLTSTTSPSQTSSNSIYFHIRAVDNVGNWGTPSHLGPFYVDATAPSAVSSLSSSSHTESVWSSDNTIDVTWTAATDTNGSGVAGYSYLFDTSNLSDPDTTLDSILTSATSTTQPESNSIYFHIRAVDNVGNWGTPSHLGPFYVDTIQPVISSASPSNLTDSSITFSWTTNEVSTSKVDFGLSNLYGSSTPETNITTPVTAHDVSQDSLIPCTTYHYRVRSIDRAGNETVDTDNTFTTIGCTGSSLVTSESISNIDTGTGGTINLLTDSTGITLTVPPAYTTTEANFQAHQLERDTVIAAISAPSEYSAAGNYIYEIKALDTPITTITTFTNPLTLTISYKDSDIVGLDESTLKIYRWDGNFWHQLDNCLVDTQTKSVTCNTVHFSAFGLFGKATVTPIGGTPSSTETTTSTTGGGGSTSPQICNDPAPASTPDLFQINVTSNSAKLFFTPIANTSNFWISYSTNPNAEEHGGLVTLARQGVQSYTINLLKPSTSYYFKVRGQNGCTVGSWSNIMKITTQPKSSTKTVLFYKNTFTRIYQNVVTKTINTIRNLFIKTPTSTPVPSKVTPTPIKTTVTPTALPTQTTQVTPTPYSVPSVPATETAPAPAAKKWCFLWWCF